jgi:hypothetical protein
MPTLEQMEFACMLGVLLRCSLAAAGCSPLNGARTQHTADRRFPST